MVFTNINPQSLIIGSENVECTFNITNITSNAHNATEFSNILTRTEIAKYETGNYPYKTVINH